MVGGWWWRCGQKSPPVAVARRLSPVARRPSPVAVAAAGRPPVVPPPHGGHRARTQAPCRRACADPALCGALLARRRLMLCLMYPLLSCPIGLRAPPWPRRLCPRACAGKRAPRAYHITQQHP